MTIPSNYGRSVLKASGSKYKRSGPSTRGKSYSYYGSRTSGTVFNRKNIFFALVVLFFVLFAVYSYLSDKTPRNYYMKDLMVSGAQIIECSAGDSGTDYGIEVQLINPPKNVPIDEENTWVGVDKDFYSAHNAGDKIGVLVCNYDVFKEKYLGLFGKQGQTYEKNIWSVSTAYDSLEAVQGEYPHQQFTDTATLKSKVNLGESGTIFVLNYQDREMTDQVDSNTSNLYNVGDSVTCDFEGYGDFIRVTAVK